MVVLINQGSASASEIVAGALRDDGRAKLIGATTFGTGTVLTQFPLSDGSSLVLAIQEWLTPLGKTIWHTGLAPDTAIAMPAATGPLFPDAEKRDNMTLDQIKAADTQLSGGISALP
jgi:carboxyl-terminal processing protease